MKKVILLLSFLGIVVSLAGQSVETITRALKSGDAKALIPYLDSNVEIAVPGKEDILPKDEAVAVLDNFFLKNRPQHFSEMHQGRSKGQDSKYIIGNLNTANGTFRVYIYMKNQNGQFAIQELRIDRE